MNDYDELLQERLARLEAGELLTTAGTDLPEDTAVSLNLAAELKEMTLPEPDETAVAHHRAAVLRAAQQQLSSAEAANQPTAGKFAAFAAFVDWWRSHRAVAVGATAFAAVLLVIFGFASGWFERGADNSATVLEQHQPAQESESAGTSLIDRLFGDDEEVADSPADAVSPAVSEETNTDSGAAVALVPEVDPAYELFLPTLVTSLQTGPQTAVLGDLQGVVSVQKPDGNWEQVSYLSSVAAGSRVRTGALSKASLTFFDGSVAKLGPDSEISIDTLNALPPEEGFRTVVMTQWRGDSTHEVAFRHDGGSRYEVQSPSGTGIARGTVFQVTVLPDLTSRYTVLEGRVDVTSINVTVSVMAGQLSTILTDEPPAEPVFQVSGEGEVTAVGESWTIGGQTFATDAQTIIVGNPQLGDWVTVQGHLLDDGIKVADQIVLVREVPQNLFTLAAVVTEMGAEQWLLGDVVVLLDGETAVDPDIELDDWVQVTGVVLEDGSLLAQRIQKQSVEGSPFEFTGVVQTIGAESWSISGIEVAVDADTEIKDDPAVGDVVKVEGQITPEGVWLAREIKAEDDDDDAAKFEFTGLVETIDPWVVAGIALATDDWTEIDTAVEPGSLVKVEGILLPDGTWLAEEIKLLDDQADDKTIIYFTGEVESTDPWVISGIALLATDESQIGEDIAEGSLVQVAARLVEDGSWEIVWIRPLLPPTTGCFTVHTRITTINGSQITLANWPNITLDDDVQVDGNLVPNSTIAINICLGDDDTVVVINIIVIQVIIDTTPGPGDDSDHDDGDEAGGSGGNRVTICHKDRNTLTISESGLNGHLNHGDRLGPCGQGGDHHDDDD